LESSESSINFNVVIASWVIVDPPSTPILPKPSITQTRVWKKAIGGVARKVRNCFFRRSKHSARVVEEAVTDNDVDQVVVVDLADMEVESLTESMDSTTPSASTVGSVVEFIDPVDSTDIPSVSGASSPVTSALEIADSLSGCPASVPRVPSASAEKVLGAEELTLVKPLRLRDRTTNKIPLGPSSGSGAYWASATNAPESEELMRVKPLRMRDKNTNRITLGPSSGSGAYWTSATDAPESEKLMRVKPLRMRDNTANEPPSIPRAASAEALEVEELLAVTVPARFRRKVAITILFSDSLGIAIREPDYKIPRVHCR
jgi:hypothetical protein